MTEMLSLWEYSCNVYKQADIEEACLILQNKYDVNVPLLLFLYWSGQYKGVLVSDMAELLVTETQHWNDVCIEPLRKIRADMKTKATGDANESWWGMRESVKHLELQAEKALLAKLEGLSCQLHQKDENDDKAGLPLSCLSNVFHVYPMLRQSPEALGYLARILCAAMSQIQYDSALALVENSAVSV